MTAVVDEVGDREIILKMVDGRPGVVMRKDVTDVDGDVPQVGATIEVALLAREDPQGRMATSRGWAAKQQSWERIDAALASGELLKVKALKQVKGGLLVDLGQRAFLPASQAFEGSGVPVTEVIVSGGLRKNGLLMQVYADVLNRPLSIATS